MSGLLSVLVCALLLFSAPVWAHKASDAYLIFNSQKVSMSVSLHDLDLALPGMDADGDRQLRWVEVQEAQSSIIALLTRTVRLECNQRPLSLAWAFESLEKRTDANYLRVAASLQCASTDSLHLKYNLLEGVDASHRLVIGGQSNAGLVSPTSTGRTEIRAGAEHLVAASGTSQGWSTLVRFVPQGIHHILGGPDHLAFLLALLLPIPLFVRDLKGQATWWPLLRTITGFTLGHSLTLLLANLGLIAADLPWVEPAIAASIAISAGLNLRPVTWLRADVLALAFGLVHGMGFAGVMGQAQVTGSALYWGLAGFNLGVEFGQLAVLSAWCLFNFWLARRLSPQLRELFIVRAGSCVLIALALFWLMQRL
jgi:hydrogenase/urease accessory protein HupE